MSFDAVPHCHTAYPFIPCHSAWFMESTSSQYIYLLEYNLTNIGSSWMYWFGLG